MLIRKAVETDIDSLANLRICQLIEEGYSVPDDNTENISCKMKDYFQENISNDRFISWIAVNEGKIVATSGLCFYELPPSFGNTTGRIAYLTNMYTVPSHRRMGLATALVKKIIETAKEKGYKVVRLHASDAGKPVYEKLGFRDTKNDMVLKI